MVRISYIDCPKFGVFLQKVNLGNVKGPRTLVSQDIFTIVHGFGGVMGLGSLTTISNATLGALRRLEGVFSSQATPRLSTLKGNTNDASGPALASIGIIPLPQYQCNSHSKCISSLLTPLEADMS